MISLVISKRIAPLLGTKRRNEKNTHFSNELVIISPFYAMLEIISATHLTHTFVTNVTYDMCH